MNPLVINDQVKRQPDKCKDVVEKIAIGKVLALLDMGKVRVDWSQSGGVEEEVYAHHLFKFEPPKPRFRIAPRQIISVGPTFTLAALGDHA